MGAWGEAREFGLSCHVVAVSSTICNMTLLMGLSGLVLHRLVFGVSSVLPPKLVVVLVQVSKGSEIALFLAIDCKS